MPTEGLIRPGVLSAPEIPQPQEIPQIPQITQAPQVPQIPQIPQVPQIPQIQEIPPLPRDTLAEAHANALEWMKIRAATTQDLRRAIADLERFGGEVGELNHFLKGGDRLMSRIEVKVAEDLVNLGDAEALKAALVCRVRRSILNQIQADEETPWPVIKERLKKAFGGGRWTPEEDIFQMFRERRSQRQTRGQYAGVLVAKYNRITEKMRETMSVGEVEARMEFLSTILKVQLAKETGRRDGLPRERSFLECAQEMIDLSAREEETRMDVEEPGWIRVNDRRPRTAPMGWKKRETIQPSGEKVRMGEKRSGQARPRNEPRREDRKCHGCGKPGHLVAQCPRTRCFECGTEGHIARQCPYISRRRERTQDEPMEVNTQKLTRRARMKRKDGSSEEATEESGTSGTETDEPGSSGGEGGRSSQRTEQRRTAAVRRKRGGI